MLWFKVFIFPSRSCQKAAQYAPAKAAQARGDLNKWSATGSLRPLHQGLTLSVDKLWIN